TLEPRTFPRGLDTEVIRRTCLDVADQEAMDPEEREHVTPFIRRRPERFSLVGVAAEDNQAEHRWTVDTAEDLELVRRIYDASGGQPTMMWREILALLEAHPDWSRINQHVLQKAVQ